MNVSCVLVEQSRARARDEEARRRSTRTAPIPIAAISLEGLHGRGVNRDLARLAELGLPDHQDTATVFEIAIVERDRFSDSHAGDREQAKQRLVRRLPEGRAQGVGR
jgi:hypothetical protein